MAAFKEIRTKIKSVESTMKITKAMEMVAASKMRKAQSRMRAARPFSNRIRDTAGRLAVANPEYTHPFLVKRDVVKKVGFIVVTTDKGLCGGMNANVLRVVIKELRELESRGIASELTVIGSKGLEFLSRIGVRVLSQAVQLGDIPHLRRLIAPIKAQLDAYRAGEVDEVRLLYTRFVNSMTQTPVSEQLVPLAADKLKADSEAQTTNYIYEPDAQTVVEELLLRYLEATIYQAVAENMASEQSARRMAMKAASDNASNVIEELRLLYNKNRQAAITQEISEIVSGSAAV